MPNRKLNKATDQRDAMLRNMVTAFLWNGKRDHRIARKGSSSHCREAHHPGSVRI